MITLSSELVEGLDDPRALREALQTAVELEHATIPTYLYALYSIEPGTNVEIASLLLLTVVEEMMHMGLACNIQTKSCQPPMHANGLASYITHAWWVLPNHRSHPQVQMTPRRSGS
jgi:hypothetical protein